MSGRSGPPDGGAGSAPAESADPTPGRVYDFLSGCLDRSAEAYRPYLARDLAGEVLDLGGGTGLLFPHFDRLAAEDVSVHVVDPDEAFLARAATKLEDYAFDVELRTGRAESIPYGDDRFDAVVCSQVFCTVGDVETGLAEVGRVLDPAGEFRFLEHVHGDGLVGRVESVLTPAWKRVARGCHLNRDTGAAIAASDLDVVEMERIRAGRFPGKTYVRGIAEPASTSGSE